MDHLNLYVLHPQIQLTTDQEILEKHCTQLSTMPSVYDSSTWEVEEGRTRVQNQLLSRELETSLSYRKTVSKPQKLIYAEHIQTFLFLVFAP